MKFTNRKERIIFDFDGVIVDSFDLCFESMQTIFPQMQEDYYRDLFTDNVYSKVATLFTDLKDFENSQFKFFDHYAKNISKIKLIPGITELIALLAKNHELHIVSSTLSSIIEKALRNENLDQYFSTILGSDIAKSKVEKFARIDSNLSQAVFVTDTLGDIKEAMQVHLDVIAVSWGFHSKETFQKEYKNLLIVDSIQELRNFLV